MQDTCIDKQYKKETDVTGVLNTRSFVFVEGDLTMFEIFDPF